MTLKCTVDGSPEYPGHLVIYACHHCGKPVCEQHGWVVSADDGFDDSPEDQGRRVPQAARLVKRVPQPAMHCKQCADKDHPKASKHPRWVDTREAQRAAAQARGTQQQAGGQPGQQYPPQQGQYPPQQ